MSIISKFCDGISSLTNKLVNSRNPINTNIFTTRKLSWQQLRSIEKTGIANRVATIKSTYPLRVDSMIFEGSKDKAFYTKVLAKKVRKAARSMITYGRGIIVINEKNTDLSLPLIGPPDLAMTKFDFFSGDMVYVSQYGLDLNEPRYYEPIYYEVRGRRFHYSRVVDFRYKEVEELIKPQYQFGGVSEFELTYEQLMQDGILTRSTAALLERGSRAIYKIEGFRDLIQTKQEDQAVTYITALENLSSILGASIMDSRDSLENFTMQLPGMHEMGDQSLRRMAMVYGIPVAWLVGENVRGLNSTGSNERQIFEETMLLLQEDHYLPAMNELMSKIGKGEITFKEDQFTTPDEKMNYHKGMLENAVRMQALSLDYMEYLHQHGVVDRENEIEKAFGIFDSAPNLDEAFLETHRDAFMDALKLMDEISKQNDES